MGRGRCACLALAFSLVACGVDTSTRAPAGADISEDTRLFVARDARALSLAEEWAHEHLLTHPELLDGVGEIWTTRVHIDELDMAHTRVQQTIDTIPVLGGESIVHLGSDGSLRALTDTFVRGVQVNTRPHHTELEAEDVAVGAFGGWDTLSSPPRAELYIVRYHGVDHLVYRVALEQLEPAHGPAMPVAFVDAHTAELVMWYDALETARSRQTHDALQKTLLPGTLRRSNEDTAYGDAQVDDAHEHAGTAYDYFFAVHGRDSYDDAGAAITSTVHYDQNYVNAFWNGAQLVFGDGNGTKAGPLTVDDVVYHELAHAVTTHTAGLIYMNESGALNEATSDIMAAAIEAWAGGDTPWYIAEDCWTPATAGDALRYMNDPSRDGSSRDHYSTRYTGYQDNGGVHWNSGIANLFFYLLSQGGTHPKLMHRVGTVTGIGIERAAAIWYRALAVYMTSSTTFAGAREATESACADLYASSVCASVAAAWDEVGVSSSRVDPASCTDRCGGSSTDGSCYCDTLCILFGDCCKDYKPVCR